MSQDDYNFSRKGRRKTRTKAVDPLYYAGYFEDTDDIAEIERHFYLLEQKQIVSQTKDNTEVARQLFIENATPKQVPISLWYEMQEDADYAAQYDDIFSPVRDFDDPIDGEKKTRSAQRSKAQKKAVAAAAPIGHLGAGADLWPRYKLACLDPPDSGPINHSDNFPNVIEYTTREAWKARTLQAQYHRVPKINVTTFFSIVGEKVDMIIMDPPFGHAGWDRYTFFRFIKGLKPRLQRSFIMVWVDPEDLCTVVDTFTAAEYVFCDSVVAELLDEHVKPYRQIDPNGIERDSRMAVMFRTDDIVRSDLKQQRAMDAGFGIVQRIGKSYRRISMPSLLHELTESMLPPKKGEQRVYVDLWPSFFDRRPGWILIDEEEVPSDVAVIPPTPPIDHLDLVTGCFEFDDSDV